LPSQPSRRPGRGARALPPQPDGTTAPRRHPGDAGHIDLVRWDPLNDTLERHMPTYRGADIARARRRPDVPRGGNHRRTPCRRRGQRKLRRAWRSVSARSASRCARGGRSLCHRWLLCASGTSESHSAWALTKAMAVSREVVEKHTWAHRPAPRSGRQADCLEHARPSSAPAAQPPRERCAAARADSPESGVDLG